MKLEDLMPDPEIAAKEWASGRLVAGLDLGAEDVQGVEVWEPQVVDGELHLVKVFPSAG